MTASDFTPLAVGRLRWLRQDDGGRVALPPGPTYAATARFDPALPNGDVSVILTFVGPSSLSGEADAEMSFLAPELVRAWLVPGLRLAVMEGPKRVADFVVDRLV